MRCLCGADDCRRCHPENFRLVGGSYIYVDDLDDDELARVIEEEIDVQVQRRLDQKEDSERGAE